MARQEHETLRRERASVLEWECFRIDLIRDQIWVHEREVFGLQRTAVRFLAYLVENAGRVCTHEEMRDALFGGRALNERHNARIVSTLRRRCGAAGALISTHRGHGYGLGVCTTIPAERDR